MDVEGNDGGDIDEQLSLQLTQPYPLASKYREWGLAARVIESVTLSYRRLSSLKVYESGRNAGYSDGYGLAYLLSRSEALTCVFDGFEALDGRMLITKRQVSSL